MDICAFHEELISEYAHFSRSFTESAWQTFSRPPIRLAQSGVSTPTPYSSSAWANLERGGKATRRFPQKRHSWIPRSRLRPCGVKCGQLIESLECQLVLRTETETLLTIRWAVT